MLATDETQLKPNVVVKIPASYSGGAWFKSRPGPAILTKVFVVFFSPSR
jgi:hypothetical protein